MILGNDLGSFWQGSDFSKKMEELGKNMFWCVALASNPKMASTSLF